MIAAAIGLAALFAVPAWMAHRWPAPPRITPVMGLRYLLMCCAVILLSLVARTDPLTGDLWLWTMAASLLCAGMLVLVLWWEVRES